MFRVRYLPACTLQKSNRCLTFGKWRATIIKHKGARRKMKAGKTEKAFVIFEEHKGRVKGTWVEAPILVYAAGKQSAVDLWYELRSGRRTKPVVWYMREVSLTKAKVLREYIPHIENGEAFMATAWIR